jgi:hypothetical protein
MPQQVTGFSKGVIACRHIVFLLTPLPVAALCYQRPQGILTSRLGNTQSNSLARRANPSGAAPQGLLYFAAGNRHALSLVAALMPHSAFRLLLGLLLVSFVFASTGCVRRRLTVRSNPPGAQVFIDDVEIGTTPCSTAFTYYGTRKITVIKDGFETTTVYERMNPVWYEIPPLDFVSETVWPGELRDERAVDIALVPQQIVPPEQLRARGEQLRASARQGQFIAPGRSGSGFSATAPQVVAPQAGGLFTPPPLAPTPIPAYREPLPAVPGMPATP